MIFATLVVVAFATSSAHAAPGIPRKGLPVELSVASLIELARAGCGYAYHRTLWQDGWPVERMAAPVAPATKQTRSAA